MNLNDVVKRLVDQYELVVHNQAVTHERLSILSGLMIAGVLIGLIILGVQIAILVVKIGTRREMADIREMLVIVKGWAYNARANVNDANATLQTVKNAAEAQIEHDRQEAEAKAEKERAATERKGRRDTLDEYRELLRFKEKDAEEWRRQVHEVRGENQILQTRVATLGVELQQVRERLQDCEDDRQDLWDALEKAGIPVRHRRREVQIPRGPAPETDVSDEPE